MVTTTKTFRIPETRLYGAIEWPVLSTTITKLPTTDGSLAENGLIHGKCYCFRTSSSFKIY